MMCKLKSIALLLLIIGGLNWGLVGLFDKNLVTMIFGTGTMLTKVVYILVGVSALLKTWCWMTHCKNGECHNK